MDEYNNLGINYYNIDYLAKYKVTDKEIIEKASLKETSLYNLALLVGINNPTEFVSRFIAYEKEVVRHD